MWTSLISLMQGAAVVGIQTVDIKDSLYSEISRRDRVMVVLLKWWYLREIYLLLRRQAHQRNIIIHIQLRRQLVEVNKILNFILSSIRCLARQQLLHLLTLSIQVPQSYLSNSLLWPFSLNITIITISNKSMQLQLPM